jgi:hypothetical protein
MIPQMQVVGVLAIVAVKQQAEAQLVGRSAFERVEQVAEARPVEVRVFGAVRLQAMDGES